jgi:hypothetical protein
MAALAIASRSLSRELAGDARPDRPNRSVSLVGGAPVAVG